MNDLLKLIAWLLILYVPIYFILKVWRRLKAPNDVASSKKTRRYDVLGQPIYCSEIGDNASILGKNGINNFHFKSRLLLLGILMITGLSLVLKDNYFPKNVQVSPQPLRFDPNNEHIQFVNQFSCFGPYHKSYFGIDAYTFTHPDSIYKESKVYHVFDDVDWHDKSTHLVENNFGIDPKEAVKNMGD